MTECPKCHKISYNKNDEIEQYCANCHMFYDEMFLCRTCGLNFSNPNDLKIHEQLRHRVVNDQRL